MPTAEMRSEEGRVFSEMRLDWTLVLCGLNNLGQMPGIVQGDARVIDLERLIFALAGLNDFEGHAAMLLPSEPRETRLLGSLWNPDLQARLQRIHERLARQAEAGGRAAKPPPPPQDKRRRTASIGDVIAAVLTKHPSGLRVREIERAVVDRLDDPVSESTVKTCLWREARRASGRFERIGRGRYRLRP